MKYIYLTILLIFMSMVSYSQEQVSMIIDKDGDGHFISVNVASKKQSDFKSKGYVLDNSNGSTILAYDCDDTDPTKWRNVLIYRDEDRDGWTTTERKWECIGLSAPDQWREGYKGFDCDDKDLTKWRNVLIYRDADRDGWTTTERKWECIGLSAPDQWREGYKGFDCDDDSSTIWRKVLLYRDLDEDTYTTTYRKYHCIGSEIPAGWRENFKGPDCDDDSSAIWRKILLYPDEDGDGYTLNYPKWDCIGNTINPGWSPIFKGPDCNDTAADKWQRRWVYSDIDNDGCTNRGSYECVGVIAHPYYLTPHCNPLVPPITNPMSIEVYPNPVQDRLNITSKLAWESNSEIKIMDNYGRVVKALNVPSAVKGQTFTINTSDLKPGIYQLTIRRGELIESKTIAVKL